jgi:hypothetical protein
MAGAQRSELCTGLFKIFCILTLASEYVFALLTFIDNNYDIRLEAFTASELNKIFSGNKPCQLWIKAQCFRDHLRLHQQENDDHSPDDRDRDGL